jgi:hypothetical protein
MRDQVAQSVIRRTGRAETVAALLTYRRRFRGPPFRGRDRDRLRRIVRSLQRRGGRAL